MLNNLDLYKLRLLSDLTASESVSVTAQNLGVSASAVSQTVKLIEDQIGKQLFLRVGKKLKATSVTKDLCLRTKIYFDELSLILDRDALQKEEIKIGAPPLFGSNILTSYVCRYLKENLKIKIFVHLNDTQQLIEGLLEGKYDFAFVDETPALKKYPEISLQSFWIEELVMCCSIGFQKTHGLKPSASFKELQAIEHVPYHKGKEGVHKWYLHHFGKVPELEFSATFDNPYAVLQAIRADFGLGVLPLSFLEFQTKKSEVLVLEGRKPPLKSRVQLAQLNSKIPSKQQKVLIEFLKAQQR